MAVEFSTLLPRTTPNNNVFALVGDSRAAADHSGSDATSVYHAVSGIGWWIQNLTRGAVLFPQSMDFAVSGYTTEDVIANGKHTAAAASSAGNVLVLLATNDRTADGNTWPASRTITALTTILQTLVDARKRVYVVAELPRGDSSFTSPRLSTGTPNQLRNHMQVRRWLMDKAPALFGPNLIVVDAYPVFANPTSTTGDAIVGMTYDGLHPNAAGAYAIANVIASHIAAQFPPAPFLSTVATDVYDATYNPRGNLAPNGQVQGTGGTLTTNVTGSLADNTTATTATFTGLSAVCSKVTTSTGDWQQIVLTGNSAAGTPLLNFRQSVTYANLANGDVIEGAGEWEVDASSVGLKAISLDLARLNTGTTLTRSRSGAAGSGPWPAVATSGVWRTPSNQTIDGSENQVQLSVQMYPIASTTGVNVTLRYRNLSVRKVV